ncbi:hypothetical protein E2P81_ATG05273 [Venturia nashicola]|nr:hypothetical protein E2P81_ATG05273 [Venturia nashicola]
MKLSTPLLTILGLLATSTTSLPTTGETSKTTSSLSAINHGFPSYAHTERRHQGDMYAQPGPARDKMVKKLGERILDELLSMEKKDPTIAIHTTPPQQKGNGGEQEDAGEVQERDEKILAKRIGRERFFYCFTHNEDVKVCPWGMLFNPLFNNDG